MIPVANSTPAEPASGGPTGNASGGKQKGAARSVSDLNDKLRRTLVGGRIVVTAGVHALDQADRDELWRRVQAYENFDVANDPYGEHDFGRVDVGCASYYWKIEYYDVDLDHGSPDPADEAMTRRVMTIMRSDEY